MAPEQGRPAPLARAHLVPVGVDQLPHELKDRLTRVLNELLEPMRQRRAQHAGNMARVREALEHGTGRARAIARETMEMVHDALDLDYLRKYR